MNDMQEEIRFPDDSIIMPDGALNFWMNSNQGYSHVDFENIPGILLENKRICSRAIGYSLDK